MTNQLFRAAVFGAWMASAPCAMAQQSPRTKQEITHLLDAVGHPGCKFERNGTAKDFIQRGATASSLSGKAYRVRCDGGPAVDAGPWLTDELRRYRGRK